MRYQEIASINGQLSPARATGFLWIREPCVIAFEHGGCRITWIFSDSVCTTDENFGFSLRVAQVPLYACNHARHAIWCTKWLLRNYSRLVVFSMSTKRRCLILESESHYNQSYLMRFTERFENRISSLIHTNDSSTIVSDWQMARRMSFVSISSRVIQPRLICAWTREKIAARGISPRVCRRESACNSRSALHVHP